MSRIATKELPILQPGVDGNHSEADARQTLYPEERRGEKVGEERLVVLRSLVNVCESRHKPEPHEGEDEESEPRPVEVTLQNEKLEVVYHDYLEQTSPANHQEAKTFTFFVHSTVFLRLKQTIRAYENGDDSERDHCQVVAKQFEYVIAAVAVQIILLEVLLCVRYSLVDIVAVRVPPHDEELHEANAV